MAVTVVIFSVKYCIKMLRRACLRSYLSYASVRVQEIQAKPKNVTKEMPSKCISRCNRWNSNTSGKTTRFIPAFLILAASLQHQSDESKNKDVEDLLKRARQLSSKQITKKAEELYIQALHLALERYDRPMIADIQAELANIALQTGDYDKAVTLLKNSIKNLIGHGINEKDITILEISLKLATLYATSQKHDIAINGYEWVIAKSREKLIEDFKNEEECRNYTAFLGMALDSYGRYLFMMKKITQALEVTKEAIEISTQLFGNNDIRTLVLLNDYGAILTDCGEYTEAENAMKMVIENAAKCKDARHSDVAVFWVNLGSIYMKDKKSDKAKDAFKKAKKEAGLSKNRSLQLQVEHYIAELIE